MAKTLIVGQTVNTPYGDVWDQAILVVDNMNIDFRLGEMTLLVSIYKDATARTEGKKPYQEDHFMTSDDFLAYIDTAQAITTLKSQAEDYALTLTSRKLGPYNLLFE